MKGMPVLWRVRCKRIGALPFSISSECGNAKTSSIPSPDEMMTASMASYSGSLKVWLKSLIVCRSQFCFSLSASELGKPLCLIGIEYS